MFTKKSLALGLLLVFFALPFLSSPLSLAEVEEAGEDWSVQLKSRSFTPPADSISFVENVLDENTRHVYLQFHDFVATEQSKAVLENRGITLLNNMAGETWVAALDPQKIKSTSPVLGDVRWIGEIRAEDKVQPQIKNNVFNSVSLNQDGSVNLVVEFYKDVSINEAEAVLSRYDAAILDRPVAEEVWPMKGLVTTALSKESIALFAQEDSVLWIEQVLPLPSTELDESRTVSAVDTAHSSPYDLDGSGIAVGVYDGGDVDEAHPDFWTDDADATTTRVLEVEGFGISDHATHVAGILAGDGGLSASDGGSAEQWKGVAPGADIYSYDFRRATDYDTPGPLRLEYLGAINDGISLMNNSWGTAMNAMGSDCEWMGDYTQTDIVLDGFIYEQGLHVIFSAGNDRHLGNCGADPGTISNNYYTINPPKAAKNTITVGAINSDDSSMTVFSNWGPTDDGRIKPLLMAAGCDTSLSGIQSAASDSVFTDLLPLGAPDKIDDHIYPYTERCGTSMAAPAVSGIVALMHEQYSRTFDEDEVLSPSTVRALLVNTAEDMGNSGPDFEYGFGLAKADAAIDALQNREWKTDTIYPNGASSDDVEHYALSISDLASENLKITLAWDDPSALAGAAKTLIHNLDLSLVSPSGLEYFPWKLDPYNASTAATSGDIDAVVIGPGLDGALDSAAGGDDVVDGDFIRSGADGLANSSASNDDIQMVHLSADARYDFLNNIEQIEVAASLLSSDPGVWRLKVVGQDVSEAQVYSLAANYPFDHTHEAYVRQAWKDIYGAELDRRWPLPYF